MLNNIQSRTLVFFANPFGFGPAGKAVALMKEIKKSWTGPIIFACSEFCGSLIHDPMIQIVTIDERNEDEIKELLLRTVNPYVVSCLNRFSIKVAHQQNIPCVMVDSLMWFWNKVHDDFALADYYYVQNIPGSEENIPSSLREKVILVPAIIGDLPKRETSIHILIHIGGCRNPLYKKLQTNYLDLLKLMLSKIENTDKLMTIYVAGGNDAIGYLSNPNSNIHFVTLERDKFLNLMASSKHFITTSGLTATLEAFAIGIPTSFYLPSNQSQWALLKMLQKHKAASDFLQWDDYGELPKNFKEFNEGDAIPHLEKMAQSILKNPELLQKLTIRFMEIVMNSPERRFQDRFIKQIGIDGVNQIVEDLRRKWNF